jgi:hypothetical protein
VECRSASRPCGSRFFCAAPQTAEASSLGATAIAKALGIGRASAYGVLQAISRFAGGVSSGSTGAPNPLPTQGEGVRYRPTGSAVAGWDYWATAGLILKPGITGPGPLISGCTKMATMTMPSEKLAIEIGAAIDHRAAILPDGLETGVHVARQPGAPVPQSHERRRPSLLSPRHRRSRR